MSMEKASVVVEYVGREPFKREFPVEAPLHTVKIQAMQKFELDTDSAAKYVLQYDGADFADEKKIAVLESLNPVLTLSLVDESVKG